MPCRIFRPRNNSVMPMSKRITAWESSISIKGNCRTQKRNFRLALFLKPDSYEARRFLAYALATDGKKEAALHEFETAVKQHPDSFDAHSDVALALAAAGRREEAITELKLALQLRPGNAIATSRLAKMEAAQSH